MQTNIKGWEQGIDKSSVEARQYIMSHSYAVGDVISHATFGIGVVTQVIDGYCKSHSKCDVLFKAGVKRLVMDYVL